MRNNQNLTDTHRKIKKELSKVAIKTARAWAILQYAKTLWDFSSLKTAEDAWKKWHSWATRSRLRPMKTVAKSIKEKLWEIINAIVKKRTNAKLKIIKVRAKGFRSDSRFKTAIMFYLGGLDWEHRPTLKGEDPYAYSRYITSITSIDQPFKS
jgi:transposase